MWVYIGITWPSARRCPGANESRRRCSPDVLGSCLSVDPKLESDRAMGSQPKHGRHSSTMTVCRKEQQARSTASCSSMLSASEDKDEDEDGRSQWVLLSYSSLSASVQPKQRSQRKTFLITHPFPVSVSSRLRTLSQVAGVSSHPAGKAECRRYHTRLPRGR
jgi:hypothetical protein